MGLFDTLKENFSEAPEWKGLRFEKYVEKLFNPDYFAIVEKTHHFKKPNERFIESDLNPDFILRYKRSNSVFAVEAKYRSSLNKDNMLEWCKPQQLERYRQFSVDRRIPVYIVIGLGGIDDDPERIFLFPLEEAKYPALYPSIYNKFSRNPKDPFYWKNGELY